MRLCCGYAVSFDPLVFFGGSFPDRNSKMLADLEVHLRHHPLDQKTIQYLLALELAGRSKDSKDT